MKTFLLAALAAFVVGFGLGVTGHQVVQTAEAAPKFKATFINGPADGGPSNPVCFGYVSQAVQATNRTVIFEVNGDAVPQNFCFKTCQSNGGTLTAPTATLASCAANCSQDFVPLLTPLLVNTDAGFTSPKDYVTEKFEMGNDNCLSIAPTDVTKANDGGVRLYEITHNAIPDYNTNH